MRRSMVLVAMLAVAWAAAAPHAPVPGRKLSAPPTIDGIVDEREWAGASLFEGLLEQNSGEKAPETGVFRLAYDDQFVYFSAVLSDARPDQIQATERRQNVGLGGNDTVTLALDLFGNLSDFNRFTMNPRGATTVEIAGGRAPKREWLGGILAKGRIVPGGWEVEARIPWQIMRLPAEGEREVRFNVTRDLRRLQRSFTWAYVEGGRIENFGRWQGVRLPKPPPKSVKLLPFAYAGYDRKGIANAGLDARTELTDRLDLVGTISPDFRNIENQILSLDFSYFERLTSESRPFFLEGANYYRTSGDSPLFTSQRLREFDTGLKVFGKLDDDTDLGVLSTFDFGQQDAQVLRVRRQVADQTNLIFAYAGTRRPGLENNGFFGQWGQSFGPTYAFAQGTLTDDTETGTGHRFNAGAYYNQQGVELHGEAIEISPDYNPRIGFAPEKGFRGVTGGFTRRQNISRGALIETEYGVSGAWLTTTGGDPYRDRVEFDTSLTFRDGTDFDTNWVLQNFRGFRDRLVRIDLERPRGDNYRRWSIGSWLGEQGGAPYRSTYLNAAYRPINALQLSGSLQNVEFDHRTGTQFIFSFNLDMGETQSLSGRLVSNRGGTNGYLAFRQSGGAGTEFYAILGDPNAPKFRTSVILKVTVPFELRL